MAARFELHKDSGGGWRWRLLAANNQQIAASGEACSSKAAAKGGAEAVQRVAASAPIEEQE